MRIANSLLELMKDTPLVALRGRADSRPRARLWCKLELSLPGAMKDRVALGIVEQAEASGALETGGLIVESSSGTMAEGLARVGALKGYRVIIVTDPRIDGLTRAKLEALGATLEVVDTYHPSGGWQQSRLERLRQVMAANPGAFWTRQYDSPGNARAYEESLGRELFKALGSRLGALVGTVGSGGSLCGSARALRRELPDLRVVAVDAVGSALFHQPDRKRLQSGHGNSVVPGNIDYSMIDEVHWVSDAEAFNGCRELARREGIFAGGSSGAAYVVASWVAERVERDRDVVVILPDRGDRYFESVYSDRYFEAHALAGKPAAPQPETIRYAVDVAERWSRAELPRDGSVPYDARQVKRTSDLTRELGLE
ncbi:MAG TPA: cysteine synthase family protein [Thermoanaerobaculia bacterium]|nr:cysteine synthase family protein [Thermoanaerobaculia bacterium]